MVGTDPEWILMDGASHHAVRACSRSSWVVLWRANLAARCPRWWVTLRWPCPHIKG